MGYERIYQNTNVEVEFRGALWVNHFSRRSCLCRGTPAVLICRDFQAGGVLESEVTAIGLEEIAILPRSYSSFV